MVICSGYEISPNMMGIQEGYNKNFHISALNIMRSLIPYYCLRYKDDDIRVMLVSNCGFIEIIDLKFVILVACTYGEPLCDEVGA